MQITEQALRTHYAEVRARLRGKPSRQKTAAQPTDIASPSLKEQIEIAFPVPEHTDIDDLSDLDLIKMRSKEIMHLNSFEISNNGPRDRLGYRYAIGIVALRLTSISVPDICNEFGLYQRHLRALCEEETSFSGGKTL